jgi:hypothetical protein
MLTRTAIADVVAIMSDLLAVDSDDSSRAFALRLRDDMIRRHRSHEIGKAEQRIDDNIRALYIATDAFDLCVDFASLAS